MNKVIIKAKEYEKLLNKASELNLLTNWGVDNWDGYGNALYPEDSKNIDDLYEKNATIVANKIKEYVNFINEVKNEN